MQNLILEHNVLGLALSRTGSSCGRTLSAAAMLWCYPLDQATSASLRPPLYPDDATYEEVGRKAYAVMARGGVFDHGSGRTQPMASISGAVSRGWSWIPRPHGGSVWLAEDICKQVEDEAALVESEARFRGAFEGTQDALLLLTLDGIFDCNQRALDLLGSRTSQKC